MASMSVSCSQCGKSIYGTALRYKGRYICPCDAVSGEVPCHVKYASSYTSVFSGKGPVEFEVIDLSDFSVKRTFGVECRTLPDMPL